MKAFETKHTKWKDMVLKYPSDSYPQSSNTDLAKMFSIYAMIGGRGSGKTALITQLLKQYEGTIKCPKTNTIMKHRYIICSPTIDANKNYWSVLGDSVEFHDNMNDKDIQDLIDSIETDKLEWKEYEILMKYYNRLVQSKNPEKTLNSFHPMIQQELEKNDFQPPERPEKDKYITFFIADDIVGTNLLSSKKANAFKHMCIKNRHHQICVILAVQALKEIPRTLRQNISCYCLAKYAMPKVLKDFHEECCGDIPFDKFNEMYDYVHQNPFSFLCIDHSKKKDERFTNSFREKILLC